MGRFGDAFGIPFAIEGLFFFTEAIFLAIYIYGWKRLKPWPHFWTGVPIVIAGIGGTVSVVAANAWMNEPAGFTLNSAGKVVDVDPLDVIFNKAFPLQASHMLVAAYLVGGFMVASVYAVGMLRGRRDRYHRLGLIIPFTVAAIATPIQMGVGDQLARWVYNNEPTKFAAIELVPKTSSDVPETLFGHLNDDGTVSGGIAIPGLASILSDPSDGNRHRDPGTRQLPGGRAADHAAGEHRPPGVGRDGRARHAADAVVALVRSHVVVPAQLPAEQVVPLDRIGLRGRGGAGDGSRVGGHGGGPPTVDRPRLHEGGRGRHLERRRVGHVRRDLRAVRRRGGQPHVDPPGHEPALPRGRHRARARRAVCPE